MNFSENLSRLRKEKGIKQETLANDMKVSRQTVSKWENGTAMPDLKKLTALAEYFGITMDELLGFTSPSGEKNEGINDYTKAYVNELVSLENAESNRKIDEIKGMWKTSVIILSIILAFTTIVALDASKKVDDLQDEVNDISMAPSIITDDSYDNSSDISNDASYEVLSIDEKEPWLINVRFTYAPQTYTNSLKVTLGIADKSGNTKQLDYENKDGKFVLETQIDASEIDTYTLIAKDDSTTSSGISFHIPSNFSLLLPAFQIHLFSHILSSNRPAALWFCDTMIFLQKRQLSFPLTLSPAAFLSVSFCSHSFSLLVSIQPPIKRIAWDTIRSANLQHPEWFSIIINIFYKFIRLGASQPKQILNIFYFIYFLFHFILYHCDDRKP